MTFPYKNPVLTVIPNVLCASVIHRIAWGLLTFGLLFSCAEESDEDFGKERFTSIFDNDQFSATFYPIDFKQTPDGGYLVLAGRMIPDANFRGTYLLKADPFGNFVRELSLDDQYVNPVGDLMEMEGAYYFFAMDALSLQGQLIRVDAQAGSAGIVAAQGVTYPAAACADAGGFLLLSYNHVDKASIVSRHNLQGAITKGPVGFPIGAGDEVEEPIINHFIGRGKRFPFQVGKATEGLYYFNGFHNYTFSLVFTDLAGKDPRGVVQGQQDDGGFSAVVALTENRFAAARFNFGQNYFLPNVNLQTNGPTVGAYLGGNELPELIPDARVKILRANTRAGDILVYASDTRSKQIGLFFYDEANGALISSRYLGFSNPFEIASIIQTADGGLAVCGTTYLAGRFPRICIFKFSQSDLADQVE